MNLAQRPRSKLGVLVVALVAAGCAAPAVQPSSPASATAATPTPAVSATPTASAATPSQMPEPTPMPSPSVAFEAPEGILPPNSIVVVVVDALQLRAGPGLDAAVTGRAVAGDRFAVADLYAPVVRDGLDWYRLWPATVGDLDEWAAAGSGADRYLEVVPPDCPSGNPDVAMLINMASAWDRLVCFGDRSLSFEATFGCGPCDGVIPGEWEPSWLTYPLNVSFLWADFQAGVGPLPMRAPPDFEYPALGSIVRVTGHFSDPASTTCRISTFVDGELAAVDQRIAELVCREQFVVEAMEAIGTDPNYTDPFGG